MQIWPAIDIRDGKCVRLAQGDYAQETVYGSDPADMAQRWATDGASGLHIVDLDGARQGKIVNRAEIEAIVSCVDIPCQVGGGVRDQGCIDDLTAMGVERVVVGTRALNDPQWLRDMCEAYPGKLVVAVDARDGRVATDGWEKTSEVTGVEWVVRLAELPLAGIIYTDIARDGMLSGPNIGAMQEVARASTVPVIASGGVTTINDISQLAGLGIEGCIVGRSLYEGRLTLADAMNAARSAPAGL